LSVSGSETVKEFREACEHAIVPSKVSFHSAILLQHIGIQDVFVEPKNYCLIHVHGELTDVIYSRNGMCVFFGSFPIGTHTIKRNLAKKFKVAKDSVDSMISMYEKGTLDANHGHKIIEAIHEEQNIWSAELEKITVKSNEKKSVHTVISAHKHEPFFIQALKSLNNSKKLERLDIDDINKHVCIQLQFTVLVSL
jgi:cell division ATPase FtsA